MKTYRFPDPAKVTQHERPDIPHIGFHKAEDVKLLLLDAQTLAMEIHTLGLQTQRDSLDLTTAEFRELFELSQRLLRTIRA